MFNQSIAWFPNGVTVYYKKGSVLQSDSFVCVADTQNSLSLSFFLVVGLSPNIPVLIFIVKFICFLFVMNSNNIFNLFSLLLILFLNFKQNVVFSQKLSPIYANHFFSRQFFKYFNESVVSVECKTVADYVDSHPNEDWALKCMP